MTAGIGAALLLGPSAAQADEFEVINLADAGAGSLREALAGAAASPGDDVDEITFGASLQGTIHLSSGELEITSPTFVNGPAGETITIDAGGASRIFHVHDLPLGGPDEVEIHGLNLTGGSADRGGAILSERRGGIAHHLTVSSTRVLGNEAGQGGGIYSDDASLSTNVAIISRNSAGTGGGGTLFGGGIYVADTAGTAPYAVDLRDTFLVGNSATDGGAGMYVAGADGNVRLANVQVVGGQTSGEGAGVVLRQDAGNAEIRSSTFSANRASEGGGGLLIGAVPGRTLIANSTIANNIARFGGGIYSRQDADGPVAIQNSTIADNIARDAPGGGGIFRLGTDGPAPGADVFAISSTVIANNSTTRGVGPDLRQPPSAPGKFSIGHSLVGDTTGAAIAGAGPNLLNRDPRLGALGDHGGLGNTLLPAASSPLVDAGVANGYNVDQRGEKRRFNDPARPQAPGSDGTDIGAVELQQAGGGREGVANPIVKARKKQKVKRGKVLVKVTAGAGEHVKLAATGTVKLKSRKQGGKPTTVALKSARGEAGRGSRTNLVLVPGKRGNKAIVKRIRHKGKATATVQVTLTNDAGDIEVGTKRVKLKSKKSKHGR